MTVPQEGNTTEAEKAQEKAAREYQLGSDIRSQKTLLAHGSQKPN